MLRNLSIRVNENQQMICKWSAAEKTPPRMAVQGRPNYLVWRGPTRITRNAPSRFLDLLAQIALVAHLTNLVQLCFQPVHMLLFILK